MRQTQKPNRNRNKPSRKPNGGFSINRVYESTGPEGKVRGTPQQIIEKYQSLARDRATAGDRVLSESFLQHAEHYMRILTATQGAAPLRRDDRDEDDEDGEIRHDRGADRGERDGDRGGERRGERSADPLAVIGDDDEDEDGEGYDNLDAGVAPQPSENRGQPRRREGGGEDEGRRPPRRRMRRDRGGDAPARGERNGEAASPSGAPDGERGGSERGQDRVQEEFALEDRGRNDRGARDRDVADREGQDRREAQDRRDVEDRRDEGRFDDPGDARVTAAG